MANGYGSVSSSNGSGWPKNIRILRIRIPATLVPRDLVEVQPEGETLEALVIAAGQLEQEGSHHVLHTQSSSFIRFPPTRREIITVRGQSYVSRLPKY
jgi:hypothetical protein